MGIIQRVVKPKTSKGKKALLKREPQLIEGTKQTLCIKSTKTSQIGVDCLKDLYDLKKPEIQMLQNKNNILPFEDITPVEKFAQKHNSPMFMFISHNKKRPNNLVMGRMFEHNLLDMVEFGIENFKPLKDFKTEKITTGTKPMLVFQGDLFEHNPEFIRMKNLLTDMFQREVVKNVRLQGLEHVLSFTAHNNSILLRSYKVLLKKSGTKIPRIELEEIGPRMDLTIRRQKLASDILFKQACKKPKELKEKVKKNLSSDGLANKLGRIHIGAQKLQSIQTRKMKGLKKTMAEKKAEKRNKSAPSTSNKKQKTA